MSKEIIHTDKAPQAIGTYSQAVKHQGLVFISGQIPLDPQSMEIVEGGIEAQIQRVFESLSAICTAAGGSLDDIVKLTIFLTDLGNFPQVNTIMGQYFSAPYPARAAVEVSALPKGVDVEMDAILAAP
jgi:reactive intermediate/imine deaminase